MIRTFLTTTALAALMTAGAVAQDAAAPASATTVEPFDLTAGYKAVDTDDLVSRLLGQAVYTSAANDGEIIGSVNDLVLDENGGIRAVILGVGGFLGAGEKNVAVDFSSLKMEIAEDNSERWVLEGATADALNAAPAFEFIDDSPEATTDTAATDPAMAPADGAMAPATDTAAAPTDTMAAPVEPATDTAAAPADTTVAPADNAASENTGTAVARPNALDRSTMSTVETTALTAEELIGTRVVGPDDEHIAEVGDLVLTPDGQIDAVLVDFGGFLGIGEKRVAVAMDNLEFAADADGNRYVFLPGVTREQLDAAPAYNAETYATDTTQRMTVGM